MIPEAVADAIENAKRNEIDNAHFFAGDVRLALASWSRAPAAPTCWSSTRPAPGSRRRSSAGSSRRAPKIVYVSCNPTTLAPNAAQLTEAGYTLNRASSPWICFRRRPTSSAWRCSSVDRVRWRTGRRPMRAVTIRDRQLVDRRAPRPGSRPRRGAGQALLRPGSTAPTSTSGPAATRRRPARRRTSRGWS